MSSSAILRMTLALPRTIRDFQAVVVVQMDVDGGKNHVVVVVLDVGKARLHMQLVVVIDQRDGAGDFPVAEFLAMLDELGADHVGNGQRAVVVAFFARHTRRVAPSSAGGRETLKRVAVSFFMAHEIICNGRNNASEQLQAA